MEKLKYTIGSLFAGIGGIDLGFQQAGFEIKWANEIDKKACETYKANFNHKIICDDIKNIDAATLNKVDLITAGFPCQAFSIAGLKKGFNDTRGAIFFDIVRILRHQKPKVVLLENVKGLVNHDKGNTFNTVISSLENLGYKIFHKILNARDFGLPQNRQRIYIVGFLDMKVQFTFPEPFNIKTKLGNILEKTVDEKYTISDKAWKGHQKRKEEHKKKGYGFGYCIFEEESEYTSTIRARYCYDGSEILIKQKDKNPRKLTPREALRLQGFPENYNFSVSDTQAYKQCGNSVAVPVINAIAKQIYNCLSTYNIHMLTIA